MRSRDYLGFALTCFAVGIGVALVACESHPEQSASPVPSASGGQPADPLHSHEMMASGPMTGDSLHRHHEGMMTDGGMMAAMCPMAVPGTMVATSDTPGGVAIAFTTTKGEASELRGRVRQMAEMHNSSDGTMMPHPPGTNGGSTTAEPSGKASDSGACGGLGTSESKMMPAATATVVDVDGGARLVLIAKNPAQLQALRQHAASCSNRMQHGECGMMSH